MQSPFSESINGWSCAVLAQLFRGKHRTLEKQSSGKTLPSPCQWLIPWCSCSILKSHLWPCTILAINPWTIPFLHLSLVCPVTNSVKKYLYYEMRDSRVVSFPGDPKAMALCWHPIYWKQAGIGTAGGRRVDCIRIIQYIDCIRIIVLRKSFLL